MTQGGTSSGGAAGAEGTPPVAGDTEHEERIAYLATGFALGALETAELQELYDALREKGRAGRSAAGVAWKVLGLTVDLRASLGTQFQDTVVHRVAAAAGDADGPDEFIDRFRAQMGTPRPRLGEVDIPDSARRAGRAALVAAAALAALALVAFVFLRPGPEEIALVRSVRGTATVEGGALTPGAALDRRPVIVGAGGLVELEWPEGHAVAVEGPANLVPQGGGLSLSSGAAWVRTGGAFTVGLPDGRARLDAGTAFAVEVAANRSVLGVSKGRASLGGEGSGAALEPGQAAALPDAATGGAPARFRWRREAAWHGDAGARILESDRDAAVWRFEAVLAWGTKDDSAELRGPAGARGAVRIEPGALVIVDREGRATRHELAGAPLLARRVEMTASAGRSPEVRVEGLAWPVSSPFDGPPSELRLGGAARLRQSRYHTGPPPGPRGDPAGEPTAVAGWPELAVDGAGR